MFEVDGYDRFPEGLTLATDRFKLNRGLTVIASRLSVFTLSASSAQPVGTIDEFTSTRMSQSSRKHDSVYAKIAASPPTELWIEQAACARADTELFGRGFEKRRYCGDRSAHKKETSTPKGRWRDRDARVVGLMRATKLGPSVALNALDPLPARHHGIGAPDDSRHSSLTHLLEIVRGVTHEHEWRSRFERYDQGLMSGRVTRRRNDRHGTVSEDVMVSVEQAPIEVVFKIAGM